MPSSAEARIGARLRSMTGYAQAVAEEDGFTLRLSLRSVNHRFLDLHVHLPEQLSPLETKVRRAIKEKNPRGHLELKVALEWEGAMSLAVDEALVERYVEVFRRLGARLGLSAEPDLATLSRLPGVVAVTASPPSLDASSQLEAALWKTLQETLQSWDEMRAEEARILGEDLQARVARVGGLVEGMEQWWEESASRAQQRLRERLLALLGEAGLDATRVAQEAAVLADRADISEEILRLKAHVAQFREVLGGEADVGKKLDFLLQEMHRELNTSLAKIAALGATGLPLTQAGLEMKVEVEQLREQVQNFQ